MRRGEARSPDTRKYTYLASHFLVCWLDKDYPTDKSHGNARNELIAAEREKVRKPQHKFQMFEIAILIPQLPTGKGKFVCSVGKIGVREQLL